MMLTRLTPTAVQSPRALEELEGRVTRHIRNACKGVEWVDSYGILGPCDYLDIFKAPDLDTASKVSALATPRPRSGSPPNGRISRKSCVRSPPLQ